jgi:hypothetical protein
MAASTGHMHFSAKSFGVGRLVIVRASYFRANQVSLVADAEGLTGIRTLHFPIHITFCQHQMVIILLSNNLFPFFLLKITKKKLICIDVFLKVTNQAAGIHKKNS